MATAYLEGEVSNTRLQELLIDHPSEITRMLQGLCHLGVLQSDNRRRWSRYQLSGGGVTAPSLFDTIDSIHLSGDSIHLSEQSQQNPDDLEKELKALASSVATKRKAPAEEIRSVIIQLCTGRHLTVDSLACYLNRNPVALRSRFLKPMVRQGVLSLRYPNSPNRPDQAYTATEDSQ